MPKNDAHNRAVKRARLQEKHIQALQDRQWFKSRSLFAYDWAIFLIMIGAREAGKSYDIMNHFLKEWKTESKPFTWLRLTEPSVNKMLSNNAAELVDADLARKYDLELSVKGKQVFDHEKPMCKVLALSTFYNDKGVALYDNQFDLGYNICLDEMNREKCEKNTFDITYAFVGQMENLVRSTKDHIKVCLIGNNTQEAADILCCFNFIPEEFGRYKLVKNKKKLLKYLAELRACKTSEEKQKVDAKYKDIPFGKRAIIDYIPVTNAYKARRKGTIADILKPTDSNFTNENQSDYSLIDKRPLKKPSYVIKFKDDKSTWFTMWNNGIIAAYNKETVPGIAMRKFISGEFFNVDLRDQIIESYDARGIHFRDLITSKKFKKELQLLKGSKY